MQKDQIIMRLNLCRIYDTNLVNSLETIMDISSRRQVLLHLASIAMKEGVQVFQLNRLCLRPSSPVPVGRLFLAAGTHPTLYNFIAQHAPRRRAQVFIALARMGYNHGRGISGSNIDDRAGFGPEPSLTTTPAQKPTSAQPQPKQVPQAKPSSGSPVVANPDPDSFMDEPVSDRKRASTLRGLESLRSIGVNIGGD